MTTQLCTSTFVCSAPAVAAWQKVGPTWLAGWLQAVVRSFVGGRQERAPLVGLSHWPRAYVPERKHSLTDSLTHSSGLGLGAGERERTAVIVLDIRLSGSQAGRRVFAFSGL